MAKASIVILNWNTRDYLARFLPPLIQSLEGRDAELVVADNASEDDSLHYLSENWPAVRYIPLDRNYGFTGGYNRALSQIDAEYFLLMNSDIEVAGNWLDPLIEWMDSHPRCAVCGPKLHSLFDRDSFEYAGAAGGMIDVLGYPFCRGRVLKRLEKDYGQYDSMTDGLMWVSGACLMVRSSVWKSLGGLDDRFFAHMEEIDFCWRAQLAGYDVNMVPQSVVWHLGGGTLPSGSPWKLQLNYRNNLLMLDKNLAATFSCAGMEPRKAAAKADRRLKIRLLLDCCSAMTYLLRFKFDEFGAVRKAHREFFTLRSNARTLSARDRAVEGIYPGSIIVASLLKGRKVFDSIVKQYEDSH